MPRLGADSLTQGYARTPVIANLSWSIDSGVHGLLGPNGAGKSTLLNTMAGILEPKKGYILIDGQVVHGRAAFKNLRRRVNILPQNFSYPPGFTALDYVSYGLWIKGYGRDIETAADSALARVGMGSNRHVKLKYLSGGMLQRAGIAQAIAGRPRVVLLDEPTVGLDPAQRLELRAVLRELGETTCVAISTHIVDDVAHLCTGVSILKAGTLVFHGHVDDLAAQAKSVQGMSRLESAYLLHVSS